jgi:hypothetical protein
MTMIGSNQNFFLTLMNSQSSAMKAIVSSLLNFAGRACSMVGLELVFETVPLRGLSRDPVCRSRFVDPQIQDVLARKPHDQPNGHDGQIKHQSHDDGLTILCSSNPNLNQIRFNGFRAAVQKKAARTKMAATMNAQSRTAPSSRSGNSATMQKTAANTKPNDRSEPDLTSVRAV